MTIYVYKCFGLISRAGTIIKNFSKESSCSNTCMISIAEPPRQGLQWIQDLGKSSLSLTMYMHPLIITLIVNTIKILQIL